MLRKCGWCMHACVPACTRLQVGMELTKYGEVKDVIIFEVRPRPRHGHAMIG